MDTDFLRGPNFFFSPPKEDSVLISRVWEDYGIVVVVVAVVVYLLHGKVTPSGYFHRKTRFRCLLPVHIVVCLVEHFISFKCR